MLFFKEYHDTFLVDEVQQRKLLIFSISIIIILGLTISATAFYFDFQYFETDKTVYEVGESINMVAKLVADFGIDGYCFVSFAVVTDQGPTFADEYFIPPSPDARLINSNYTIRPEHTNPSESGATAYALFNVEIFDTVTQGASDNVQITITRGHLTVYPETPLIIQSDANTTMNLNVASIHNSDIVYANEEISIIIKNPNSEIILNENMTTSSEGSFNINWNQSMGLPGTYDLMVIGHGNEDFLEFSEELQISVIPSLSNLIIVSSPVSIPCQSPAGSCFDYANIVVRHEAADYTRIDDSTVFWNSSFGSGSMAFIGDGEYLASIPCMLSPNQYWINITAINHRYQTIMQSIMIDVVRNPLSFLLIHSPEFVVHGDNITIEFLIEEGFNWDEQISLDITDSFSEIVKQIDVYPNTISTLTMTAWHNLSIGSHSLTIHAVSNHYDFSNSPELQINIIGEFTASINVESAYCGESILLNLSVVDYDSNTVELVNLTVYYGDDVFPFVFNQQANSTQLVSIPLPLWIGQGCHDFRFEISAPYFLNVIITENITVLMKTTIIIIIEPSLCIIDTEWLPVILTSDKFMHLLDKQFMKDSFSCVLLCLFNYQSFVSCLEILFTV